MKYHKEKDRYFLVFKKGEAFIEKLTEFALQQGITAASFHGLGGVLSAELGYYHLDRKEYEFKTVNEVLEIVSLQGNIALKDGKPFVHAHGVLSDASLTTYGGHIKEMVIGGTSEIALQAYSGEFVRIADADTGLSLLDIHDGS